MRPRKIAEDRDGCSFHTEYYAASVQQVLAAEDTDFSMIEEETMWKRTMYKGVRWDAILELALGDGNRNLRM
ncbi:hypothetical protein VNO77_21496 [Canavalia gladiata]|uniref:Uncharacterized protein n=1 Tax=Canavalia gladiata TaxID=3824 RepID=A0AAN9LVC9_CANGL